jgi:hypothetical protein
MNNHDQADLLSDWSVLDLATKLLTDLSDDLPARVTRFRYIADISASMGSSGTLIFGGQAASIAYVEARSSFVNGNFIATILLCQSLIENLLAGFLHVQSDSDLPDKIQFKETLQRCKSKGFLTDEECVALDRLVKLRNPLMHFRNVNDSGNLLRRSMQAGMPAEDMLEDDASFAIGVAIKVLSKRPFALGKSG